MSGIRIIDMPGARMQKIVAMKFNGEDFYINGRTTTYEGSDGTSTGGAAIPEPATAALLIAGAAMFVAVRRRRD